MRTIKKIFYIKIPYWHNRAIGFDLYWRFTDIMLTIWFYHKVDIEQYEDEWMFKTWKHIRLWRGR